MARCPFCRIPTSFTTLGAFFHHIESLHLQGFYRQILANRNDKAPRIPNYRASDSEEDPDYEQPDHSSTEENDEEMTEHSGEKITGIFVVVNNSFYKWLPTWQSNITTMLYSM